MIKAFALEADNKLEPHKLNLTKLWPALDKELTKDIKANMASGQIDLIKGEDIIYNKVSNNKMITHPKPRRGLTRYMFEFSALISTEQISYSSLDNHERCKLTAIVDTSLENEQMDSTSLEIHENMAKSIESEAKITEDYKYHDLSPRGSVCC